MVFTNDAQKFQSLAGKQFFIYHFLLLHHNHVLQITGSDCTSNPGTGKFARFSPP